MQERSFNQLLETDHQVLVEEIIRLRKRLGSIKSVVDYYYKNIDTYTMNNSSLVRVDGVRSISSLFGMVRNHTYAGLEIPLPHDDG